MLVYNKMSWGTCYSASNNLHFDFPPIMADGRNYASWQPGAAISEAIREKEGIINNFQYRKYLIANADKIIKGNQLEACDQCSSTTSQFGSGKKMSGAPYLYGSNRDTSKPYGYQTSDLKNVYLTRQQLQSRQVTPVITQAQLLSQHQIR
tara:strand:+ start:6188 stop:6637 length:450 start_codon:yes stop_codon:yes gene_type:complete